MILILKIKKYLKFRLNSDSLYRKRKNNILIMHLTIYVYVNIMDAIKIIRYIVRAVFG